MGSEGRNEPTREQINNTHQRFLSFDCAYKSLAYTMAEIDVKILDKLNELLTKLSTVIDKGATDDEIAKIFGEIYKLCLNFIKILETGALDLLEGKKIKDTTPVERVSALKLALDDIFARAQKHDKFKLIIEDQPEFLNKKSSLVQYQIMMYAISKIPDIEIILIKPALKNKVCFHDSLNYQNFRGKSLKAWGDNKKHARANMLYFFELFGLNHALNNINKKLYPDLADSFMQIIAYVSNFL